MYMSVRRRAMIFRLAKILLIAVLLFAIFTVVRATILRAEQNLAVQARNDAWRDDIDFFQRMTLRTHPLLAPGNWLGQVISYDFLMSPEHGVDADFWSLFRTRYQNFTTFYDRELRIEFIRRLEELRERVPYLDDAEIIYGLMEAAAALGDSHTSISRPARLLYPFLVTYIEDGFYVVRIEKEHEHLIYSRLTAINGVCVYEIFERIRDVTPHETEYYLRRLAPAFFYSSAFLSYIGISDDPNQFTFIDRAEDTHTINLTARMGRQLEDDWDLARARDTSEILKFTRWDENYWNEFFPDYGVMYIRYIRCVEMDVLPYLQFFSNIAREIQDIARDGGKVERLVIDLRRNHGGWTPPLYHAVEYLNNAIYEGIIGGLYILIDNWTYSAAAATAALLRDSVEGAVIIGEPAGIPPNFFASAETFRLPENNAEFFVSTAFWYPLPDWEGYTLRPDIYIPVTLDDFMNSRDPVIDFLKGR